MIGFWIKPYISLLERWGLFKLFKQNWEGISESKAAAEGDKRDKFAGWAVNTEMELKKEEYIWNLHCRTAK